MTFSLFGRPVVEAQIGPDTIQAPILVVGSYSDFSDEEIVELLNGLNELNELLQQSLFGDEKEIDSTDQE